MGASLMLGDLEVKRGFTRGFTRYQADFGAVSATIFTGL